jgi:Na+-transporting methylmalonyl-CoA/oxaloacetate decarboxylase gamma subunit
LSEIMQGLSISIIGLLITFFALGVFILLMIVLQRLFPPKAKAREEEAEHAEPVIQIELDQASSHMDRDREVAAAIAAAVSYFQAVNQPSLGANLEGGRGRWWAANRLAAGRVSNLRKK